jgi:cytoskeleton protein RodZ
MVDADLHETETLPVRVGERLRTAREAAGYDLNDVGTRTRIPVRHLEAIERSDYAALPSSTYALGFTKSFARAVGLDESAIATALRTELGRVEPGARDVASYDLVDPARVPSRLLAWTAAAIALILAIGYGMWRSELFGPRGDTPVAEQTVTPPAPAPDAPAAVPAAPPVAEGPVVLTAKSAVWLRITDAAKKRLYDGELAIGQSFTVPADANDPRILTGRPDALKVTIGGVEVAPLGPPEKTIADVPVTAAALKARPPAPAVTTAPPVTTPR